MRIGMLGCGNIGRFLLASLNNGKSREKIVAIHSRNYEKTKQIASQYDAEAYESFDDFLEADLDLVVEVATIELVEQTALQVLEKGLPLIVSSIGAFSDPSLLQAIKRMSEKKETNIYIPSGAVGGLDILQSSNVLKGLQSVQLTTRKPAYSLTGAEKITEELVVFEGKAKDAIAKYPRNMNVAIAISLAGIGTENTKVRLIADPQLEKNMHTIEAEGDFGTFSIEVSNQAMPENPKTSYLAALSVLSSVKEQNRRMKIV